MLCWFLLNLHKYDFGHAFVSFFAYHFKAYFFMFHDSIVELIVCTSIFSLFERFVVLFCCDTIICCIFEFWIWIYLLDFESDVFYLCNIQEFLLFHELVLRIKCLVTYGSQGDLGSLPLRQTYGYCFSLTIFRCIAPNIQGFGCAHVHSRYVGLVLSLYCWITRSIACPT